LRYGPTAYNSTSQQTRNASQQHQAHLHKRSISQRHAHVLRLAALQATLRRWHCPCRPLTHPAEAARPLCMAAAACEALAAGEAAATAGGERAHDAVARLQLLHLQTAQVCWL
jgi:hypothetical protein